MAWTPTIFIIITIIFIIIIIRDYQETLHQSQEQMEGAQAILDSSQVLVIIMALMIKTKMMMKASRPSLTVPR